jgi:hypothetical protein
MSKQSRLFVIDASVMRSAGDLKNQGYPSACSQMLQSIELICHRVAITTDVRDEWNKHQSKFAKIWRARMIAKKKLIPIEPDKESIQTKIKQQVPKQNTAERRALLKDAHLLAATYAANRVLLTADHALHALCDKHAVVAQGQIEWIELLPQNTATQNYAHLQRLVDLATTHPNPPLPT